MNLILCTLFSITLFLSAGPGELIDGSRVGEAQRNPPGNAREDDAIVSGQVGCAALHPPYFISTGEGPGELILEAEKALKAGNQKDALALADKAVMEFPKAAPVYAFRASLHEQMDQYTKAIADWTKFIELEPKFAVAYQQRGLNHFKAGRIKESIQDFDKYIEMEPKAKVSHWQRGISYYYAGEYDKGMAQFEGYQDFDSNDVENAVWRFMCQVKKDGIEKARKDMLKIGDDKRVPMRQIYELYAGRMKPEEVLDLAAKTNADNKKALNSQLFYAHLYVGIYHDLLGNRKLALGHLNRATEDYRIGHYMWDVARVHRDLLKK